jgi:hypothetical protein
MISRSTTNSSSNTFDPTTELSGRGREWSDTSGSVIGLGKPEQQRSVGHGQSGEGDPGQSEEVSS